jgi:hypothetical protein
MDCILACIDPGSRSLIWQTSASIIGEAFYFRDLSPEAPDEDPRSS